MKIYQYNHLYFAYPISSYVFLNDVMLYLSVHVFVPKILIIFDFKERNFLQGAIISFGVATIGVKGISPSIN